MKKNKKYIYLTLLVFISIGFAYLSTTLNLNGNISFNENKFDIHFENIKVISEDVSYSNLEIDSTDSTIINSSINFKEPSEIFEYTVDVVNAGGIDAIFSSITNNIDSTNEEFITIDIKYYNGNTINENDLLRMGQSKRIRVKIIYNYNIENLPTIETTSITTKINYKNINVQDITYDRKTWDYDFTGYEQVFVVPKTGTYKIELWGAEGGYKNETIPGGKGAYITGNIVLDKGEKFYIFVGEHPTKAYGMCYTSNDNSAFNSSNLGGCSVGGGATDIRLIRKDNWEIDESLASRIIVAAGGGAALFYNGYGGAGGELKGQDGLGFEAVEGIFESNCHAGVGGTQTTTNFGKLNGGTTYGGGGYYSGEGGKAGNAGGGSSFISGYKGCIAITSETDLTPICTEEEDPANQDIACSYHYSGYKFTDGIMIGGNKEMTNPDGTKTIGHAGNGYARITLIS